MIIIERPTATDFKHWLIGPLADALGGRYGGFELSILSQKTIVADGTTVLLLEDSAKRPLAVALCSAPTSPDMVRRSMDRARQAKALLDPVPGVAILEPLAEGTVRGLSYAVLPYCKELSDARPLWWIQRTLLRGSLLAWLWRVTECTVRDAEADDRRASFAEPLLRLSALRSISERVRMAAERASERLHQGAWVPRHVLMHGDLWKGNVLLRTANGAVEKRSWRKRFVVIDWAGSEVRGYAIYDLVRLAQSMHLNARQLRGEVSRHCRLLRCQESDAISHLLAALGYILLHPEHFPMERYVHIAESCFATLEQALD